VSWIAVQADGKILVGGNFAAFNGATANRLVRLNADGTPGTAFNTLLGTGANGLVLRMAIQADGKIVVSGGFTTFNGAGVGRMVRLNADGTRETAFNTNLGTGFNNNPVALALKPDGKIVAGGVFTTVSGSGPARLARLNADASVDTAFAANLGSGINNGTVSDVALQPDGRIVVGGNFTTLNGASATRLAGLNADGTPDGAFNANLGTGSTGQVLALLVRPDATILAGESLNQFNGATTGSLFSVNEDGTADSTFNARIASGFLFGVSSMLVQPDGKIVAGGGFTGFKGTAVNRLARIVLVTVSVSAPADRGSAVGEAASVPVTATTDGGPIVYSASNLPPGLAIDAASGVISGSPTTVGSYAVTVTATSSGIVDTASLTWTVTPQLVAPAITSGPPPGATLQAAYSFTVTASGFPAPTFSVSAGALPDGLGLDSATGEITGTPTNTGSFDFTVTATNSAGAGSRLYTVVVSALLPVVAPPVIVPPVIASGVPGPGVVGRLYSFMVAASGVPAPTFAVASGRLPAGLRLDPATGAISGTPSVAGSFSFTVTATNSAGSTSRRYKLRIGAAPVAPKIGGRAPSGRVASWYSFKIRASGSPAPRLSVTRGRLPPGLTLARRTGVIRGVPTRAGTFAVRVTAANTAGRASATYRIVIRPPVPEPPSRCLRSVEPASPPSTRTSRTPARTAC
jgi:uncharacterized delta-60 repeat protein